MTLKTLHLSDRNGRLGYREAGAGEPIVLIHGVGLQSAVWKPQIEALSQNHLVIALDMPGHGDSSCLPPGATLEDFVDWLLLAVNALGLNHFSLAGHSMGALISGGFAVSHPERVTRVALINGVFRRDEAARDAVEARARLLLQGCVDHNIPLARWFGASPEERSARNLVAAWLNGVNLIGYSTAYSAFAQGDATYADGIATLNCPLLALTGGDDQNSTPAMARAIAAVAPNGRAEIVEGHRHMVTMTAPTRVNEALQRWLTTSRENAAFQ